MRPNEQHDNDGIADPTPDTEYQQSRKRLVMKTVLNFARAVANGKYVVRRGAINWAAYDFSQPGIAVFADESTFLRDDGKNRAVITIELMMKMPDDMNQIDDDAMDDLHDHASWVFGMLEEAEDPENPGYSVIARLDRTSDSAQEVSDSAFKTQGLIATVPVEF